MIEGYRIWLFYGRKNCTRSAVCADVNCRNQWTLTHRSDTAWSRSYDRVSRLVEKDFYGGFFSHKTTLGLSAFLRCWRPEPRRIIISFIFRYMTTWPLLCKTLSRQKKNNGGNVAFISGTMPSNEGICFCPWPPLKCLLIESVQNVSFTGCKIIMLREINYYFK